MKPKDVAQPNRAQPNFPALEEEVLARWRSEHIFEESVAQRAQGPKFVFFEGPPTANGKPGVHHVLARIYKDVIPRYKTMRGFHVERKAGWDTHGLPVELEVEKKLGLKSKKEIEEYGIAKFNEECKKSVWEYKEEFEKLTERIGFWLDAEHPYVTYDPKYVESLWWIIKQMWENKLLYQGYKVVPYCPRCGTPLSSHEVAQGYKKVEDTSAIVKFKVKNLQLKNKKEQKEWENTYLLAWTTTPWTLPGNVGLAVGEDVEYVILQKDTGERVVLAVALVESVMGDGVTVVERVKGHDLIGLEYEPLFPGAIPESTPNYANAFKVYAADFVTTEDGTGIVHTAVMYGEDDYQLGEKVGLPKVHTVAEDGTFNKNVPEWEGWPVKHKDKPTEDKTTNAILEYLEKNNLLFKKERYSHDYPHCWRCNTPLLYYAKTSWFVAMSKLRKQLLEANDSVNWVPAHIKEGRFGEWLREVKDWAFSRERYWATPLPIWICEKDSSHRTCIGSFEELQTQATEPLAEPFDPHRPFVDDIKLKCSECGGDMLRVKEVCDVWFDSGAMPFAQWHYPFENEARVDGNNATNFPADFISEAIDQTRGWFYTLLAVSVALEKGAPYKNVICLAHVLDAKGQKMSKSKGNVVDPWDIIAKFGADSLRFHFVTMNQPGDYKLFDEKQVGDAMRKNFMILWNVVSFWELASAEAEQGGESATFQSQHVLDKWILARMAELRNKVTDHLEAYQITEAGRAISEYISDLSTWYVRRSRARLKSAGAEGNASRSTLRSVLIDLSKVLAPFTPMLADALYGRVNAGSDTRKASVHLEDWPEGYKTDATLIASMNAVRALTEAGHALREEAGIKVRQPLGQLVAAGTDLTQDMREILQDELNIHDVIISKEVPTGADWKRKQLDAVTVALDVTLTDELMAEGWYRETARQINDLRKQAKMTPSDRITVSYSTESDAVRQMMQLFQEQLKADARADVVKEGAVTADLQKQCRLGEHTLTISITKVS